MSNIALAAAARLRGVQAVAARNLSYYHFGKLGQLFVIFSGLVTGIHQEICSQQSIYWSLYFTYRQQA
jgi:hypothetical protein